MKKLLYSLVFSMFAFSCASQSNFDIEVEEVFNCLFTVTAKSGTDPNFQITGTLANASGKFAPLTTTIDTGDYVVAQYAVGSNRFTATYKITGKSNISGSSIKLTLVNKSGQPTPTFPSGTHSVVRPTSKGFLPIATNSTEENRVAAMNYSLWKMNQLVNGTIFGQPEGVDTLAATCLVDKDPDSIAALQLRTLDECAFAFDYVNNKHYFYDGSRDSLWRWIPLDSLPILYPNYALLKFPDGSAALDINDGDNSAIIYSDNGTSIIRAGDDKTTITANDIELQPRGSGHVKALGTSAKAGDVQLYEDTDNGTNYVRIKAPDNSPADYILEAPAKNGTLATTGDVATVQADVDDNTADIASLFTGLSNLADTQANDEDSLAMLKTRVNNLTALTGRPYNVTHMGTYPGSTVGDNGTIKQNITDLETAHETTAAQVATNTSNIATNAGDISDLQGNTVKLVGSGVQEIKTPLILGTFPPVNNGDTLDVTQYHKNFDDSGNPSLTTWLMLQLGTAATNTAKGDFVRIHSGGALTPGDYAIIVVDTVGGIDWVVVDYPYNGALVSSPPEEFSRVNTDRSVWTDINMADTSGVFITNTGTDRLLFGGLLTDVFGFTLTADTVTIANTNRPSEAPNGVYPIYYPEATINEMPLDRVNSFINTSFTGDLVWRKYGIGKYDYYLRSEDTTIIAGSAIFKDSIYIDSLTEELDPATFLTWNPDTKRVDQAPKSVVQEIAAQIVTDSLAALAAQVATNTSNIATNTSNIATNTSNISANTTAIGDLQGLSGVAANATDFGTFTGSTIPDGSDNKEALQALETAVEAASGGGGGGDISDLRGSDIVIFDDFIDNVGTTNRWGDYHWVNTLGGSATTAYYTTYVKNHPGILNMKGHATNTFTNLLTLGAASTTTYPIRLDSSFTLEIIYAIPFNYTSLDGIITMGLASGTYGATGVPTDGIYVVNGAGAGGTVGYTNAASITTVSFANDSSTSGAYDKLKITYNYPTSTVTFYMNGVSQGTSTTNLPTGTNLRLEIYYTTLLGSAGATVANGIYVDAVYFNQKILR